MSVRWYYEINKATSGGQHAAIIKEIQASVTEFDSCMSIFEGRCSNVEANSLAKVLFLARAHMSLA